VSAGGKRSKSYLTISRAKKKRQGGELQARGVPLKAQRTSHRPPVVTRGEDALSHLVEVKESRSSKEKKGTERSDGDVDHLSL